MSGSLIGLIDDMPLQRVLAKRVLGNRSGIVYPETPAEIRDMVAGDFGLVIVDRVMPEVWRVARDEFLDRLAAENPACEVIEWTAYQSLLPAETLPAALHSVQKSTAEELMPYVDRWLKTGHVLDMESVA